jgi:hypothetical protein
MAPRELQQFGWRLPYEETPEPIERLNAAFNSVEGLDSGIPLLFRRKNKAHGQGCLPDHTVEGGRR